MMKFNASVYDVVKLGKFLIFIRIVKGAFTIHFLHSHFGEGLGA